jgi:hypothetical protein
VLTQILFRRCAAALQIQYERWKPGAKYKLLLDPTADEVSHCSLASCS